MSRSLLVLILVIVVVVGGLFWLAGRDAQQPTHPIEKTVPLANLQNAAAPQ